MPRQCTVCAHDLSHEINVALVRPGASNRGIARQYRLDDDSVRRHRAEHLPKLLVKSAQAAEIAQADELLAEVRGLHARTLAILEASEHSHEHRTALAAIREARGNLELLAKLLGELDERPVINITSSPVWVQIRTAIVVALEPHPAARDAVLSAIEGVSGGADGHGNGNRLGFS